MRHAVLVALAGCGALGDNAGGGFDWHLPPSFPAPKVPDDNPMSQDKVDLGRHLFYDVRLSRGQNQSCGSCHQQALAFTDGRANAVGSTGDVNRRSAMSLVNVAYYPALTWANSLLTTLEQQATVPLLGDHPVELGMAGHEQELLERLRAEPRYPGQFAKAFPDDTDPIALANVLRAIAAFERTILSGDSPYDRFAAGDASAVSDSAQRGANLFLGERLECHHCHGTFAFTASVTWQGKSHDDLSYQNDALYNIDGMGSYPARDHGLAEVTQRTFDMGKFRAPTVRNIAMTAPYMHDGTIAGLRDVIVNHYARGGRLVTGADAGDGALSPIKNVLVTGFEVSDADIDDLLAFLESLTDPSLLTNPALSDPWPAATSASP